MRKGTTLGVATLVVAVAAWTLWPSRPDLGQGQFFSNATYNFEAVRALNDLAPMGADSADIQRAVSEISAGDSESWYHAWTAAGERTLNVAERTKDRRSRGFALLRAHDYFRTAEFFLAPEDPRRPDLFKRNVDAFYRGLDSVGVNYERIEVPYGRYHLNAVYYPGSEARDSRPLLVVVNGYDGTLEELYLSTVAAALDRGYAVLTYEGPGQGSVLREQGLPMQADWEKPNGAVLDRFLASHRKPKSIVLIGESLGGYLAPRAAAFDSRIDGVVAFDIWFDGYAIATRKVSPIVFWMHEHGMDELVHFLAKRTSDPGAKWALQNGQWVFGVEGPIAVFDAFKAYSLAPIADRITQHVLLLAGADDHFVPISQLEPEQRSLTHAKSVKTVVFDHDSGGGFHCQIGAPSLWQAALFDWLSTTFEH